MVLWGRIGAEQQPRTLAAALATLAGGLLDVAILWLCVSDYSCPGLDWEELPQPLYMYSHGVLEY